MVIKRQSDNGSVVEVTHPIGDQVLLPIATLGCLAILIRTIAVIGSLNMLVFLLSVCLLLLLHTSFTVLRTRIIVSSSTIETRCFRVRTVEISLPVQVVKNGPIVEICSDSGNFRFRFSKYLGHRGRLYEVLFDYFD